MGTVALEFCGFDSKDLPLVHRTCRICPSRRSGSLIVVVSNFSTSGGCLQET